MLTPLPLATRHSNPPPFICSVDWYNLAQFVGMTHDKTISTYSMDKLIMMNTVKVLLGKLEAHMLDRVTQKAW